MEQNSDMWHLTYKEISHLIGEDNTIRLYKEYRGTQVAFPMRLVSRESVKMIIKENYPTRTINQLAIQTGYSERNVRHLIKEIKNEKEQER